LISTCLTFGQGLIRQVDTQRRSWRPWSRSITVSAPRRPLTSWCRSRPFRRPGPL